MLDDVLCESIDVLVDCGLFSEDDTVEALDCGSRIVEDEFIVEDEVDERGGSEEVLCRFSEVLLEVCSSEVDAVCKTLLCVADDEMIDDIVLFPKPEELLEFSELEFIGVLELQAVNVSSVINVRKSAVSFLIFIMISSLSVLLFFFDQIVYFVQ